MIIWTSYLNSIQPRTFLIASVDHNYIKIAKKNITIVKVAKKFNSSRHCQKFIFFLQSYTRMTFWRFSWTKQMPSKNLALHQFIFISNIFEICGKIMRYIKYFIVLSGPYSLDSLHVYNVENYIHCQIWIWMGI